MVEGLIVIHIMMMGKDCCRVRVGRNKAGGNEVMPEWIHEVEEP